MPTCTPQQLRRRSPVPYAPNAAPSKNLAKLVPLDYTLVSESGIFSNADLLHLSKFGARSFLIGESLMREENVEKATAELLGRT